jgi:hypothetical protein
VKLKDGGVVQQSVDGSHGHARVGKYVAPAREGLAVREQALCAAPSVQGFVQEALQPLEMLVGLALFTSAKQRVAT